MKNKALFLGIVSIVLAIFIVGCEGTLGPIGPQGESGIITAEVSGQDGLMLALGDPDIGIITVIENISYDRHITIIPGKVLTIAKGITLTITGTNSINNNGSIINAGTLAMNTGATITNTGIITNGLSPTVLGTITVNVLNITNNGIIDNSYGNNKDIEAAAGTGTVMPKL